ncbi:GerAB/ArcD/ProY family transporter [Thermoactinomyces mirandus]|uniref:Endospore germination permease n=1 Tax=Thermoactinomyces mirandus TaxID=2756294 RepID=A0A7W2ARB5_9BACL|nr:endospore germination permease [Thermoactinomyces mirandus]MBA4602393.1 endospore germination permease [Thermoactinomyces mirandus]
MSRKTASKDKITSYQAFTLLYSTLFGVGVMTLPRDVGEKAGNDLVWVIFLSGFLVFVLVYLISTLCQRFPGMTFTQYTAEILGGSQKKWIGKVLSIPFVLMVVVFFILGIGTVLRMFGETITSSMLRHTPLEAIMLILILTVAFGAGSKLEVIAKLNEFLFPITLAPFLLMLFAAVQRGDFTNILPLFQINLSNIIEAILRGGYSFAGYLVIMIFAGFYQEPGKMKKIHTISLISIIVSYWYLCVITLGVLGIEEVKNIMFPVLEVAKSVKLEDMFFERIEAVILSIWLVTAFTSILNLYAAFVQVIIGFFHLSEKYRLWISFLTMPGLLLLAMIPKNVPEIGTYGEIVGVYEIGVSLLVPLVLLLIAVIRRKKGEVNLEIDSSSK